MINVVFEFKLFFTIAIIIICQKWTELCLSLLLLLQLFQIYFIHKTKLEAQRLQGKKRNKVFENLLTNLSFYLIEITLTCFILGAFFIHIFGDNEADGNEPIFLIVLSFLLIGMVILSILVDFVLLLTNTVLHIYRQSQKRRSQNKLR